MMERKQILISAVVVGLLLALAVGMSISQAQEPELSEGDTRTQSGAAAAEVAPGAIPIQGLLTDADDNPLDGTYTVTFSLYEQESGGAAICSDTRVMTVTDGLFSDYMDGCYNDLHGQKVWLGVEVGSDGEMAERQVIYSVPYALGLRPGAVISDARDNILTLRSTGSGDIDGLVIEAGGAGETIEAHAEDGTGIWVTSDTNLGLNAHSYDTSDYPGVYGCSASDQSTCADHKDDSGAAGVSGYGGPGVFGQGTLGYGVLGKAGVFGAGVKGEGNALSFGGWFTNTDQVVLLVTSGAENSDNAIQVDGGHDNEIDFRVTNDGDVYGDGGSYHSPADFAEMMAVSGDASGYEPGDVLIISPDVDQSVTLAASSYSSAVVGVYSTEPGFVAGYTDDITGEIPVAMVGVVPCKVSAENGAIQRGELLVTASMPGHAMRAGDNPPQGTVLGKALGELTEGTGVIEILVTLQ
jgi:hypothetical protein